MQIKYLCIWSKLHCRFETMSFVWMCVTAADFDLQQSPYSTPLLTPALLPLVQSRHQILTRSMRCLHSLPSENHSRDREDMKERWEVRSRESDDSWRQNISSAEILGERSERGARGSCSDMKQTMSAVILTPALLMLTLKNAGNPLWNTARKVGATVGDIANSYFYTSAKNTVENTVD